MGKLDGKIAIVTGAASGMGLAQSRLFHAEGAKVLLTDISPKGEQYAAELGANAAFLQHDVASEENWIAVINRASELFGPVNILINTAGIANDTTPIEDTTVADFERIIGVNLRGVFLGMRAVTPIMAREGGGSIVNVASAAALLGSEGLTAYSASKAGVRGLSRAAAKELGKHGIRVNTIFPGAINTAIVTPDLFKVFEEFMAPRLPIQRMGTAEEIARATLFLASDDASYTTGAELTVDGGVCV
ncbi:SDR family NAD(P)-dependent oxidoreductase [Pseudomonas sp.]|uniref:SDR family NAD(P)-dependent oxidoreductase n=1 Tax=Pseudomonas sp. TaxID=306 RepID=UPI003D14D2F8